jgi:hypothetical protein
VLLSTSLYRLCVAHRSGYDFADQLAALRRVYLAATLGYAEFPFDSYINSTAYTVKHCSEIDPICACVYYIGNICCLSLKKTAHKCHNDSAEFGLRRAQDKYGYHQVRDIVTGESSCN